MFFSRWRWRGVATCGAVVAEKDALFHPPVVKQLVDGEGFAYLGRSHRLLLVDDQEVPAKLKRGRLRVRRADASSDGVAVIRRWYQQTGSSWLARRVEPWAARAGAGAITIDVAGLGYRWGSVGKVDKVNIHWATLRLPPALIDYRRQQSCPPAQSPQSQPSATGAAIDAATLTAALAQLPPPDRTVTNTTNDARPPGDTPDTHSAWRDEAQYRCEICGRDLVPREARRDRRGRRTITRCADGCPA